MGKDALFKKIDRYAAVIRDYRPLSEDEIKELDAHFKIGVRTAPTRLKATP